MKRRGLSGVGCGLLIAYAALAAGCTEFVTESAQTSLASFVSSVLTDVVDEVIGPDND